MAGWLGWPGSPSQDEKEYMCWLVCGALGEGSACSICSPACLPASFPSENDHIYSSTCAIKALEKMAEEKIYLCVLFTAIYLSEK